jgi:regulatory protein
MKIEKFIKIPYSNNKYEIIFDTGEKTSIIDSDILEFKLAKNSVVEDDVLEKIKKNYIKQVLYEKSIYYIGRRPRSIKEIKTYLKNKLYNLNFDSEKLIEEILDKLTSKNILDDTMFAQWYFTQKTNASRPQSLKMVRYELAKKGVDSKLIDTVLSQQTIENEYVNAKVIAKKKYDQLAKKDLPTLKKREKLATFLSYKGYNWDIIYPIIDSFFPKN